ncbi:hypothetical protein PCC6912_08260 [Chlorogloeopsis fritschii PCC 6912]|uniref:GAF domain-containing protein n=2 Tax=Chlorogloeopsis fritschii TaxID=1124 RepID=A0A433NQ92_CHLFR|nr:GAF domain-containing protein [Chlorogloeopsis fritschii]RUR86001.1 hypothetical protein PCC6912_08260 [Chlorogloeopsis fritschii PCC 6912]
MNHHNPKKSFSWFPHKESVVQLLVGSFPLKVGIFLRSLLYRHIFAQFGNSVTIQTNAEFIHAFAIALGDKVRIYRDVRLDCGAPDSKILIGNDTWLERGVDIKALGGSVEIDESTYIGPYICMAGPGKIKIGKNCLIASHSAMYANCHNFTDSTVRIQFQGISYRGIVIEDDCWIGSGVRILDGVTIGQGSVIGAGAVVTKDIPPYSVAVGVPAQVKYSRKNTKVSSPTPNQQNIHLGANTSSTLGTNLIAIERSLQRNHHYFQNQNDTALAEFFLEKILYIILEYVRGLMSVDTSTVLLQTQDQQELAVIATIGLEEEKSENIHIPVGKGFAGQIAANCTHMNINDLSEVEVISPVLRNKGIRSILGVPMIVKKRAIGVLHIGTFHPRHFTEKETEMLQIFANHIAYHFFTEIS